MSFKKSRQRDAVHSVLKKANYHPTVDEIYDLVRKEYPKISLATVYRNLEQLCRMQKVWRVDIAGGPARYDGNMDKHFHICCEKCGLVEDVWLKEKLEERINLDSAFGDFRLKKYKIDFFGLCLKCQTE